MTWSVARVGDLTDLANGHPFDAKAFASKGDLPLVRIRDLSAATFETYVPSALTPSEAHLRDGDIVIGMDGDFNVVLWHRGDAALNQRVCRLRARDSADERFLAYALPSHLQEINDLTYSTTVKHLSSRQVTGIRLPIPAVAEQRAIADYLDHETDQIDTLIAKQQQLIGTLRERRIRMIFDLVTHGLEATAPHADQGVTWAGPTPAHWQAKRLKYSIASSQTGTWGSDPTGDASDVLCVRVADFDRPHLCVGEVATRRRVSESDLRSRQLQPGDLLLEKSGGTAINPVGFVAIFEGADGAAVSSNFISRLRLAEGQVPRYWLYAHAASYMTRLTSRSVSQTTGIQNLDQQSYFDEVFPFPPEAEQEDIARYLDDRTHQIDNLMAKAEHFIALAKERRSALITAAVTGQFTIPGGGA